MQFLAVELYFYIFLVVSRGFRNFYEPQNGWVCRDRYDEN